ncbi:uncharacterized protein LOC128330677 [Hemicordylus capensis]|uniref:uncharacterized protein LOC128330677 n=1 Tax=Hemicordylus capensis TaxID=884348 RepID=UPI00230231F4|nr:uncharacterized protein LOC128330677 [Hemicordylus capensis]
MDEDFRGYLKDYINILVRSAGHHLKMDQNGITLTGAQFADKIKHFTARVKQLKFGFASVPQMAYTINNLGIKEELEKKFSEFIKDQKKLSGFPKTLTIKPSTMEERLQEKTKELLQEYEDSKQGDESSSKDCKSLLKCHLNDETKDFLKKYKVKYYATAGVLIGTGSVVLASGAIGAGVVGALVAAEAVALGTGAAIAGGATGGLAIAGGTVGHVIGRLKGERSAQQAQNMTDHDTFEEEEEEDLSEEACLIGRSAKLRVD